MNVELEEIRRFLAEHEPFSHLPEQTLQQLPGRIQVTYVRRGEEIVRPGQRNDELYIIRSGAIDIVGEGEMLLDRREAGLNFGYSTLMGEPESLYTMQAVEDSLLLVLPGDVFRQLIDDHPDLKRFFLTAKQRVSAAAQEVRDAGSADVLRTPLAELVADAAVVSCGPDMSVQEAAQLMGARRISCLIVQGEGAFGIVTDRDMRSRVVAQGRSPEVAVRQIMTTPVRTISQDALVFEAMLLMSELGVHHLPIEGGNGQLVGVVNASDVMRLLQLDPMYLAADVGHSSYQELEGAYGRAVEVAVRFFERGASALEVQRLLTLIADALARRFFELGIEQFGPPPVPFAFVVVGSQARGEMSPASDQDNALVLDESFDPAQHGEYFARLADFVCQGLAWAGQGLCPGAMMASNMKWRLTVPQWVELFYGWSRAPEPDALLHAQVFFDFRAVYGVGQGWEDLADGVRRAALEAAHASRRLHTHLAALATYREPPIGFFRGFVVERSGDYADTLDVKRGGTAAVVQLARLYAIVAGEDEVATLARLRSCAGGPISAKGAHQLEDAYEYLADLVLRQQVAQMRAGERPDYRVDPKKLAQRDRAGLRDAFGVIRQLQQALGTRFSTRAV